MDRGSTKEQDKEDPNPYEDTDGWIPILKPVTKRIRKETKALKV